MTGFHGSPPPPPEKRRLREYLSVFQYSGKAVRLVWTTSRFLTVLLAVLNLLAGVMPALIAYVGKLLVDSVVLAASSDGNGDAAVAFVLLEAGLMVAQGAIQRGINICQQILRAQLGHKVNLLILDKALSLELRHFEDSEFYDKLTRARREASSRPLGLVMRTFGLAQNLISLVTYGALLVRFSPLAALVLALAPLPAFAVETRFSDVAFRLFRWRTPETRQQAYLETVIAREDTAKEVKLFGLGPTLLQRYDAIFRRLYREDRNLTLRRSAWGFLLNLLSTGAFYGVYVWIVVAAAAGQISLGDMTMYVAVFQQGGSAVAEALSSIGGMYEDNLYLSNLYELLETEVPPSAGRLTRGHSPGDGIRFEGVSFRYPGSDRHALEGVSFHLPPGRKLALVGENGSGKTTLIKLLTRLYEPSAGRILLDGSDLAEWDIDVLRRRIGVIFQDFVRYQFLVGENIGVGDVDALEEEPRWLEAAQKGMAAPFIAELPEGYRTQLGRWFKGGRELSLGQWQKVALARAFMRQGADILVLDEPTASMDAAAEAAIFERFKEVTATQMAIVISHRFSTVRMADHIIVLATGRILEEGSHEGLVARNGHYASLFSLQAAGYR